MSYEESENIQDQNEFEDHSTEEVDSEIVDGEIPGSPVKRAATVVAGGVSSVVKRALHSRDHVLMVRVNDESLDRINDLKDAGLFRSRSEAAAYLIAEGIEAKSDLFTRIQEKIRQIQDIKSELQALAEGGSNLLEDE